MIQRHNITTPKGNIINIFFNDETNLLVVDLVAENECGGNELLRQKLDEDALLEHTLTGTPD